MSISPESVSAASQARLDTEREMAVLKKTRDIQKDQAQALVDLVRQAVTPPPHVGTLINVVA